LFFFKYFLVRYFRYLNKTKSKSIKVKVTWALSKLHMKMYGGGRDIAPPVSTKAHDGSEWSVVTGQLQPLPHHATHKQPLAPTV
jgi:hypothetical protein